jgi:hypothetical protein
LLHSFGVRILRFWLIVHAVGFWLTVWVVATVQASHEAHEPDPWQMGQMGQMGQLGLETRSEIKNSSDFEFPLGTTPRDVLSGSSSGSTLGRAENPWGTRGKPQRADGYD